jgi:eukaryotic-like serine/threonine-protein kinase
MSLKKQGKYRFNEFELDLAHRSLRREGRTIAVSSKTLDLLILLVLNAQRAMTKDELVRALWPHSDPEENNLSQHIFLLRKALKGRESGDKLIVSIPGRGFQFSAPVIEVQEADTSERWTLGGPQQTTRIPVELTEEEIEHAEKPDITSFEHDSELSFLSRSLQPGVGKMRSLAAMLIALAILCLCGWLGWRWLHRPRPNFLGLVIADFDNSTGDLQFDQVLKTALTADLRQSPYLKVASAEAIEKIGTLEISSSKPPASLTAQAARQVCTRLGDQAYLTGGIRRLAQKYLVTVQAFDCAGSKTLAASRGIADSPDSVLTVLDKVAADLRKQLGEPGKSVQSFNKPPFPAHINSLPAINAYADAGRLALAGKYTDSTALYQWAIELDPQLAVAYEDLGVTYSNLGQGDQAIADFSKAYELRDTVDEYDRLNIVANFSNRVTGDLMASIRNDKQWREEYPSDPVPLTNLGDLEIQIGRSALALDAVRSALELNPSDASAYEVLANAQMHLGQFEEAASTCHQAISRHADSVQIHGILLQIAFRNLDQPALDEQIAWAHDFDNAKPEAAYMQVEQGLIDFAEGRAKAAQAIFTTLADRYQKQGQIDLANGILKGVPRIEAELGLTDSARALLHRLPAGKEGSLTTGATDIAVAWAHVGETARAESLLQQELDTHPAATLWQEYNGPEIRAAIALNQHRPEAAVDALQPAAQYDLRSFDAPALRGRAYLAAGQPALAEAEFHKILDHPGIEPLSHNYPLAQLGLARSLAQQDKTVEAGFAYKVVLQIWKDADPDLPRLREAKAEYAKLTGEAPGTPAKSHRK